MSERATHIVQKGKTMQPHRRDERQVKGVEGGGGDDGQDETSDESRRNSLKSTEICSTDRIMKKQRANQAVY